MNKIAALAAELAAPIAEAQGCTLWDTEYVREGGTWYLRVFIDRADGGNVDILDCEAVSRLLSDKLDELDPIESSYTLEVGSAGAERTLKRPGDFERFIGSPVLVKLYRGVNGRKEFAGILHSYDADNGSVSIGLRDPKGNENIMTFGKEETALVRLRVEF